MFKRRKPKDARPGSSASEASSEATGVAVWDSHHQVEQNVQRELLAHPDLSFSSLVVRRVRNGVCLEGVLEGHDRLPDVSSLVQSIAGVETVINHLVVLKGVGRG